MPTINTHVITGADDGYMVTGAATSYYYTRSYLGAGGAASFGGLEAFCAIRFQSIAIPSGSTIISADLTFLKNGSTGSPNVKIFGNDVDNAGAWGSSNRVKNISKTSANTDLDASSSISINDVTAIVSEIVARGGWSSGNNLAFGLFNQIGHAANNFWLGFAYEAGSSAWPLLDITYTSGGGGNNQVIMS